MRARPLYPTTRLILMALSDGPKSGAELAEVLDDITPCVARTMANLRHRSGFVQNRYAGTGRKALYELSDAGRAALTAGGQTGGAK